MQVNDFKASELCSRKLWQLVSTRTGSGIDEIQLQQAIEELVNRRQYLEELCRAGKLARAPLNN